jgi:hypothetical protein
MTFYTNTFGNNPDGLYTTSSTGAITTLSADSVGQVVYSSAVSPSTFVMRSGIPGGGVGCVLQQVTYTRGGSTFPQITCAVGDMNSPYNAATDIFGPQTFTPISGSSTISFNTSNFASVNTAIVYFNLYINGGSPVTSSQVNSGAGGTVLQCSSALMYSMPSPGSAFSVSVCSFGSGGTSNQSSAPNDFLQVTEVPTATTLPGPVITDNALPVTQTLNGASSIVMASVPVAAGSSMFVQGQMSFWDFANLNSNSISFFFVAQRPSAGNVSISQGTFYEATISSVTSITVTANTGAQTADIAAVGTASSVWQVQLQYFVSS